MTSSCVVVGSDQKWILELRWVLGFLEMTICGTTGEGTESQMESIRTS